MSVGLGIFGFLIGTRLKDVYYEEVDCLIRKPNTAMKTASTDMPESQPQEEENKTQEQNRNFRIAIFQGIFGRISFSLSDSTTVLFRFYL